MTNRCRAADDTTASIHKKDHDVVALVAVALAVALVVLRMRMREMKIPSCVVLNMNKPNILFILICFK